MKRKLFIFTCIAYIVSTINSFTAHAVDSANLTNTQDSSTSYVNDAVADYLLDTTYSSNNEYFVSNPFTYQHSNENASDCAYYFIFENDNIIGKANYYQYDGNPYVQIDRIVPNEIQQAFKSEEELCITFDEHIQFSTELSSNTLMHNTRNTNSNNEVITKANKLDFTSKLSKSGSERSASFGSFIISGINFVGNAQVNNDYVNNKYVLCWEACLAMEYNYRNNGNLTATEVYEEIGEPNPYTLSLDEVKEFYEDYGLSATVVLDTLTTSDTVTKLRTTTNGKYNPIQITARDQNDTNTQHAMLLYGIHVYDDHTDFYIYDPDMLSTYGLPKDPNTSNPIQYIRVNGNPLQTPDRFYYLTSYGDHNYHWEKTLY